MVASVWTAGMSWMRSASRIYPASILDIQPVLYESLDRRGRDKLRAVILLEQGGLCPICWHLCGDPNLDHDHTLGIEYVRGVLCRNHNLGAGMFPTIAEADALAAYYRHHLDRFSKERHGEAGSGAVRQGKARLCL